MERALSFSTTTLGNRNRPTIRTTQIRKSIMRVFSIRCYDTSLSEVLVNIFLGEILRAICKQFYFFTVFDLAYKDFGRLESRYVMLIYNQRSVARDIPGNFLFPLLIDKAAESPDINIVATRH